MDPDVINFVFNKWEIFISKKNSINDESRQIITIWESRITQYIANDEFFCT